jgi:hypothetical protein
MKLFARLIWAKPKGASKNKVAISVTGFVSLVTRQLFSAEPRSTLCMSTCSEWGNLPSYFYTTPN